MAGISLMIYSAMCIGPIIGAFIIWQIIKLLGLEYWVRVPRQSRLKQWGQNVFLFILFLILSNSAPNLLGSESQSQNYGLLITLNIILGTLFLFGIVVSFMQSWINPEWVRWTVENYPQRHKEILLFASRGEERRKWRQNKDFEDFRLWVKGFVQDNYDGAIVSRSIRGEEPLQPVSKVEILLEKLPALIIGGFSVFLIVTVIWIGLGSSFYVYQTVKSEETGVQFKDGSIKAIVGPGTYSDVGRFVDLRVISCTAIPFDMTDDVATGANDNVNLTIEGNVFRICNDQDLLKEKWGLFSDVFINDDSAQRYAIRITRQAVKNCMDSYDHSGNIIEDEGANLRICLVEEVNQLARNVGLSIDDIAISNIR